MGRRERRAEAGGSAAKLKVVRALWGGGVEVGGEKWAYVFHGDSLSAHARMELPASMPRSAPDDAKAQAALDAAPSERFEAGIEGWRRLEAAVREAGRLCGTPGHGALEAGGACFDVSMLRAALDLADPGDAVAACVVEVDGAACLRFEAPRMRFVAAAFEPADGTPFVELREFVRSEAERAGGGSPDIWTAPPAGEA